MAADLALVRHANSVVPTPDGPGEMTRPLRPSGSAQARDLVGELSALRPTAVLSSPYPRAVQTVRPTAEALGVDVGDAVGAAGVGLGDRADEARPGGESMAALSARVVLIGTHGTFAARTLPAAGHAIGRRFLEDMPMPAVYRVRWSGDHPISATGPSL